MDNDSLNSEKADSLLNLSDRELLIATYNAASQICTALWVFEQKQKEFFWKEFQELSVVCQKIRGTFQILARTIDEKDQTPLPDGIPNTTPIKIIKSPVSVPAKIESDKLDIEL